MITQYVDKLKDACARGTGLRRRLTGEIVDADEKVAVWKHLESSGAQFHQEGYCRCWRIARISRGAGVKIALGGLAYDLGPSAVRRRGHRRCPLSMDERQPEF